MKKKLKIGITGVNPLNGNRGVGALAISTIYILNEIAKEKDCSIEITTVNYNYGKYTIDFASDKLKINNILLVSVFSFKDILNLLIKPKMLPSFFAYLRFDYILCMGEGDSFSDIYGAKRFYSINNQHRMSRLLNKKYILLPQTIGPFKNSNIEKQAKKSIEKANLVFARDLQSFKYVTENTKQSQALESIDVAFFMPYEKKQFSADYIHVGINISALLWHGGYTRNNQFGLKANYKEFIHESIDYFLAIPNVKIHIVPHVVSQDSNLENDYEVSYQLVNTYSNDRIILAPFFLTPILAKNYISGLDFFTGARMHATIAAFSSGVPVFPMAYSRKFNGLFKDTLDYEYMGDLLNQSTDTLLLALKDTFEKRDFLFDKIKTIMSSIVVLKYVALIDELEKILAIK